MIHTSPFRPLRALRRPLTEREFEEIGRHVATLERSAGRDRKAFDALLPFLSFDLPPSIVEPDDGNYGRLRQAVESDLERLRTPPAGAANGTDPTPEPSWPARFAESRLTLADMAPERRPFERSAAAGDESLWLGYLQIRTAEVLEPRLPTGHRLEAVRVRRAAPPGRDWDVVARGHLWSEGPAGGLYVHLGFFADEAARTLELWFHIPPDHRRIRRSNGGRKAGAQHLWEHLTRSGPAGRPGLLASAAGLVASLETRRKYRPSDLEEPIHLHHLARRRTYTGDERRRIWDLLPKIVDRAGWSSLTRHLRLVLRTLGPPPKKGLAADLYGRLHRRLAKRPSSPDLQFLASVAEMQKVEVRADPRFIVAVLGLLDPAHGSEAARAELREALGPGQRLDDTPFREVATCIVRRTSSCWKEPIPRTGLDELRGLGHLSTGAFRTELASGLADRLAARIPADPPTPVEATFLLEIVEGFRGLAGHMSPDFRNRSVLDELLMPLRAFGSEPAGFFPTTLWPLLHRWLTGESPEARFWTQYRFDVARWYLDTHRRRPSLLARCGRWLRRPEPDRAVYSSLATYFVEQIKAGSDGDLQAFRDLLEGLGRLCVPDQPSADSSGAFEALEASFRLMPWCHRASSRSPDDHESAALWRSFVVGTVISLGSDPTFQARRPWAAWTLRSLVRVPAAAMQAWLEYLDRFHRDDLEPDVWNAALAEIESALSGAVPSELERRRMRALDGWLHSHPGGPTSKGDGEAGRWRWIQWTHDAQNAGWIDERQAMLLQAAALRRPPSPHLEARARRLWPGAPMQLLLEANKAELERFLDLCQGFGSAWIDSLREEYDGFLSSPHRSR